MHLSQHINRETARRSLQNAFATRAHLRAKVHTTPFTHLHQTLRADRRTERDSTARAGLFAALPDLSGLAAPEIHVEEGNPKSVFLIWRCPSSGFVHCTDTFLFNDAGKIVRQTVCILNEGAPAGKAPLCTEPQGGPVQASWDNHFAAFGAQDVDKVLLDYTEKSVIKVYNQVTDELVEFKGLKGVKECFTGLFKDLSDLSGLAAPAIRVEEATEDKAGMVFLVWRCPSSGYNHATDTFLFDAAGKIAKQNVVIMKPAEQ